MEQLLVFNSVELYLAGLTTLFFILQLLYYTVTYARPLRTAKQMNQAEDFHVQPPVSIIVYAKNESENLRKYLPALLTQDYPTYEVIVINDGSTDESDQVLKTLKQEYLHLYHTYIPEDARYLSRKKLSLTVGIKAAKHDILLFTEANCQPLSSNWVSSMAAAYRKEETSIVLGFCAYRHYKGLMHKLIAYDNLLTGLQYLSSALNHHPFTGNGRNLSYRKELFFAHKGYSKSLGLHAGDDDLFINESATSKNTEVVYSSDSITEMGKIEDFSTWKEMKVSRAATQKYYKGRNLFFYRMHFYSLLLFLSASITSMIVGGLGNWLIAVWAVLLYLIRYIVQALILNKSARLLEQKAMTAWLPLLELIQPIFTIYVRIYRIFRGKYDYTFRLGNTH